MAAFCWPAGVVSWRRARPRTPAPGRCGVSGMSLDLDATANRLEPRFGRAAHRWVGTLRQRLDDLVEQWELTLGDPLKSGNSSVVFRCVGPLGDAVLKLSPTATPCGRRWTCCASSPPAGGCRRCGVGQGRRPARSDPPRHPRGEDAAAALTAGVRRLPHRSARRGRPGCRSPSTGGLDRRAVQLGDAPGRRPERVQAAARRPVRGAHRPRAAARGPAPRQRAQRRRQGPGGDRPDGVRR
ncbi:hypothetical protein NKG94_50145 [Micromonospora sp. M12]